MVKPAAHAAAEVPGEEELVIGSKLREWRLSASRTLTDIAQAAGLSIGYISQVERGMANPSLETLKRLADELGHRVAELFTEGDSDPDVLRYAVTRRGQRRTMHFPGSGIVNELLSPDLKHQIEAIWVEAPEGADSGDHPHSHTGEELGVVIEGKMIIWAGEEKVELGPGDSIYLDSTLPHRWTAGRGATMKAIWLITPPTF